MGTRIETGFVLSGEVQMFYTVRGKGKPIVLLHGNNQNWQFFEMQIACLENIYQVITIDTRGHGKSTNDSKKWSIALMAEDVVAVLDFLEIKVATILGFSDGGNIALQLAIKHPEKLKALVLVSTNINPKGLKLYIRIPMTIIYRLTSRLSSLSKWINKRAQQYEIMVLEPNFSMQELAEINIKTLVIAGEHDLIYQKHTELIAKSIKNARLEIIKKTGHFLLKQEYSIVNSIIIDFLLEEEDKEPS
ncbi:MAG: alpha/beta hydrolase [Clostridia bacterium]